MAQKDRLCDVKYEKIVRETEKAYLLSFPDREAWFAKSLLDMDEDNNTATMPEWVAVDKQVDMFSVSHTPTVKPDAKDS